MPDLDAIARGQPEAKANHLHSFCDEISSFREFLSLQNKRLLTLPLDERKAVKQIVPLSPHMGILMFGRYDVGDGCITIYPSYFTFGEGDRTSVPSGIRIGRELKEGGQYFYSLGTYGKEDRSTVFYEGGDKSYGWQEYYNPKRWFGSVDEMQIELVKTICSSGAIDYLDT